MAPPALFSSLDDDALLSIGVPPDWLADVRSASEDGFFTLAAHLPAEASEAPLECAATGRFGVPAPPPVADPFAHPDALRRIRLIVDQEELEQVLAYPWEKWGVFLHPSQRALVDRFYSGPARGRFCGRRQDHRGDLSRRDPRPADRFDPGLVSVSDQITGLRRERRSKDVQDKPEFGVGDN